MTHAHPPPNTTHSSLRTCAPSEHQSCTHQPRNHSAASATLTQPGDDYAAAEVARRIRPIHHPRPQLSTEDSREGRGRSAPPRSTRGCTRPGPLRIDTASTQSQGPRHCARGFYAVPQTAAAEGTQVAGHPHSWLRQMKVQGATPRTWPCRHSGNLCTPDSGCPRRRGLARPPLYSTLAAQGGSAVRTPLPNSKSRVLTPT